MTWKICRRVARDGHKTRLCPWSPWRAKPPAQTQPKQQPGILFLVLCSLSAHATVHLSASPECTLCAGKCTIIVQDLGDVVGTKSSLTRSVKLHRTLSCWFNIPCSHERQRCRRLCVHNTTRKNNLALSWQHASTQVSEVLAHVENSVVLYACNLGCEPIREYTCWWRISMAKILSVATHPTRPLCIAASSPCLQRFPSKFSVSISQSSYVPLASSGKHTRMRASGI